MDIRYILWIDSRSDGHWHALEEMMGFKPMIIKSVGWVLQETEEAVTLVQSHGEPQDSPEDEYGDNVLVIPRVSILDERHITSPT